MEVIKCSTRHPPPASLDSWESREQFAPVAEMLLFEIKDLVCREGPGRDSQILHSSSAGGDYVSDKMSGRSL